MADDLKIDIQIIDNARTNPGVSPHRIATCLAGEWSNTYVQNRIARLTAKGRLRSVEIGSSRRYKIYTDDAKTLEA